MLYDVKNTEENISSKKRKLSTISKTKEIKNDLQVSSKRESPKSLRKKEPRMTPPPPPPPSKKENQQQQQQPGAISRKKSKDSNRSSVHSPPPSPALCAEASRIIRRHSSSSFSSEDEHVQQTTEADLEVAKAERPQKRKVGIMDKVKKSKDTLTVAEKAKVKEEMTKTFGKSLEDKYEDLKTTKVKIVNKVAQVFLSSVKKETLLTLQVKVL